MADRVRDGVDLDDLERRTQAWGEAWGEVMRWSLEQAPGDPSTEAELDRQLAALCDDPAAAHAGVGRIIGVMVSEAAQLELERMQAERTAPPCSPEHPCERRNSWHLTMYGSCWVQR